MLSPSQITEVTTCSEVTQISMEDLVKHPMASAGPSGPSLSPMAWLLERARTTTRTHPPAIAGQIINELQVWIAVDDNQRSLEAERPNAPRHIQQYLAERRTFVDFCEHPIANRFQDAGISDP